MASLMFASAALKEVLSVMVSQGRQEVGLFWNFKDHLADMERTLETLGAVLEDAERRSVKDKAIRLWLFQLKDACYDIEDMMSDFIIGSFNWKPQVQDDMLVKVSKIFHYPSSFVAREILVHRMRSMRGKLIKIAELRNNFHLKEGCELDFQDVIANRETFDAYGSPSGSEFLGRDKEKDMMVDLILENKNNDQVPFVVPIVGFGGLGKTTLATLIFNDERMRNSQNFDIWSWTYVSMEFNLLNVATRLVTSFSGENVNSTSLQFVSQKLISLVAGKRYLIVLDDVWTENMNDMIKLFRMLSGGLKGSTVILTTRSNKTAAMVATNTLDICTLKPLSEETCWLLFQKRAFKTPDESNEYPELVEIGKKIVSKCKGVALTVIAFGSALQSEMEKGIWLSVEKNENWEFQLNNMAAQSSSTSMYDSKSESSILSSLMLSYYFLPTPLKSCFNYCSIFKKGHKIKRTELIQQWIALGFIQSTRNHTPEEVAEQYLNRFLSMSFMSSIFQVDNTEGDCIMMHDLVHDLAQLTARFDDVTHRYISIYKDEWMPKMEKYGILAKKPRALHLYCSDTMELCNKELFSQLKYLRELEIKDCDAQVFINLIDKLQQLRYISIQKISVCPNITGLPYLRYLDLSYSKFERIPNHIGNLQSLCYLNLSHCYKMDRLPEEFGKLNALQFLNLSYCRELKFLPQSFENLVHLEKLDLTDCFLIKKLPLSWQNMTRLRHLLLLCCDFRPFFPTALGITELTNLQTLTLPWNFRVSEVDENGEHYYCSPALLQHMNMLTGTLLISSLEELLELNEAEKANLERKNKLRTLKLEWFSSLNSRNSLHAHGADLKLQQKANAVLQSLQPPSSLWNLEIWEFPGNEWPSWMFDTRLQDCCLTTLKIIDIKYCRQVPPLGHLPKLEHLELQMPAVKKISAEFYGSNQVAFPSLQSLELFNMDMLEEWLPMNTDDHNGQRSIRFFPCLFRLCLRDCPKLHVLPEWFEKLSNLRTLEISGCCEMAALPDN